MRACSRWEDIAGVDAPAQGSAQTGQSLIRFAQPVRILRSQREAIDAFERLDLLERGRRERGLSFKAVQNDPFQQIAEGHVELGRERLEDLEQPALQAHSGLGSFDEFHIDVTMLPNVDPKMK
jgi:hypothetical protein